MAITEKKDGEFKISFGSTIRVKLSNAARTILEEKKERLRQFTGFAGQELTEDEDGYSRWQLDMFMFWFGASAFTSRILDSPDIFVEP